VAGFVDRRPAIIMFDPQDPAGRPRYFVLLGWENDSIATIRDFHFAPYAIEDAEVFTLR
jgi:RNA polymerase sigma-70 factor (ECF subfamily)